MCKRLGTGARRLAYGGGTLVDQPRPPKPVPLAGAGSTANLAGPDASFAASCVTPYNPLRSSRPEVGAGMSSNPLRRALATNIRR